MIDKGKVFFLNSLSQLTRQFALWNIFLVYVNCQCNYWSIPFISISQVHQFIIIKQQVMDDLYCSCPAVDCNNKEINYWYHAGCGSRTMIRYDDIFIVCKGCWKSAIMFDWKFSCGEHAFRNASKQGCLYAMAVLGLHKGNEDQIRLATIKLLQNWPAK